VRARPTSVTTAKAGIVSVARIGFARIGFDGCYHTPIGVATILSPIETVPM